MNLITNTFLRIVVFGYVIYLLLGGKSGRQFQSPE